MMFRYTMLSLVLTVGLGQPVLAADSAKPATEATKAANTAVLKELPFNNKQAFEDSARGLIAPLENNGVVKNAKGDIIWDLPKFDFLKGDKPAPDTVNPSLWRQAQIMEHYSGLFKVTDHIYQVRSLGDLQQFVERAFHHRLHRPDFVFHPAGGDSLDGLIDHRVNILDQW